MRLQQCEVTAYRTGNHLLGHDPAGDLVCSTCNSERIRLIPREKILVESDGPYSKIDGKKYQPSYLLREYELIAKALKEPDLIKLVYSNFKTLLTL